MKTGASARVRLTHLTMRISSGQHSFFNEYVLPVISALPPKKGHRMKRLRFFSPRVFWVGCLLGAAILLPSLSGCNTKKTDDDAVSIGFIYVGPKDDYGYNQAHAEGAAAVKKMPKVKIVEEEKVPETV